MPALGAFCVHQMLPFRYRYMHRGISPSGNGSRHRTPAHKNLSMEQKARSTYDNILRLVKDEPDVYEPIKFLRAREVVHFQWFGEANRTDLSKKFR